MALAPMVCATWAAAALAQRAGHAVQGGPGRTEEVPIGGAKVVESGFSIGCRREAVLGASAVAGEEKFALAAPAWQQVPLVLTELPLLWRARQVLDGVLFDVTQAVGGVDVMVAGIKTAVVLQRQGLPAGFGENTEPRRHARPEAKLDVEQLHEDRPDVPPQPLVEHRAHETAVTLSGNAPRSHGRGVVRRRRRGEPAVAAQALDERDKLHETSPLVSQEAVDLAAVTRVGAMDHRHRVERHPFSVQQPERPTDSVEGGGSLSRLAVTIVQAPWAVDAEADQEVVFAQEHRPAFVQQRSIGLQGIGYLQARWAVLALERECLAEERPAEQRRLTALPHERDLARFTVRFDVVPDEGFQESITHTETMGFRIEPLLVEVITVAAVQVALGPNGLDHHREGSAWPRFAPRRGR